MHASHRAHAFIGFRMDEFYNGEFVRMFPQLAKPSTSNAPTIQPAGAGLVPTATPPTHQSKSGVPKQVSSDEVEQFIRNPSTLIGTRFVHSPPQDQEQGNKGTWKVASYTVREGDRGVEHEYQILLEAFGGDPLPMSEAEVRYLLQYSTFAV